MASLFLVGSLISLRRTITSYKIYKDVPHITPEVDNEWKLLHVDKRLHAQNQQNELYPLVSVTAGSKDYVSQIGVDYKTKLAHAIYSNDASLSFHNIMRDRLLVRGLETICLCMVGVGLW